MEWWNAFVDRWLGPLFLSSMMGATSIAAHIIESPLPLSFGRAFLRLWLAIGMGFFGYIAAEATGWTEAAKILMCALSALLAQNVLALLQDGTQSWKTLFALLKQRL